MKKRIFVLFALLLVILSAGAVKAADLVIYAALDEKTPREIIKAFKERIGLDAELALQIEQAGTVASRIKTEAKNPRADVFIGGNSNIHASLAAEGFLDPYRFNDDKRCRDRSEIYGPEGLLDGVVSRGNVHPLQYEKI